MVAVFDRMPSTWRFLQATGVNPGERSGHQAEVQLVIYHHRISTLAIGTADFPFQRFQQDNPVRSRNRSSIDRHNLIEFFNPPNKRLPVSQWLLLRKEL
jgi:hypothetical protein